MIPYILSKRFLDCILSFSFLLSERKREKKREKERSVGNDFKLGLNLCLGLDRFVLELFFFFFYKR